MRRKARGQHQTDNTEGLLLVCSAVTCAKELRALGEGGVVHALGRAAAGRGWQMVLCFGRSVVGKGDGARIGGGRKNRDRVEETVRGWDKLNKRLGNKERVAGGGGMDYREGRRVGEMFEKQVNE